MHGDAPSVPGMENASEPDTLQAGPRHPVPPALCPYLGPRAGKVRDGPIGRDDKAEIPPYLRGVIVAANRGDREMADDVTVRRIAGESLRLLGRSLWRALPVWIVAAVLFTGTNLVDIVYGSPQPGHGFTPAQIVSLAIRVIAPLWVSTAAWRIMLGSSRPAWAPDGAFWRYVLAALLITGATFGLALAGVTALKPVILSAIHDKTGQMIARGAALFALLIAGTFVTIRLSLWPVALAIGDKSVTFVTAWRAARGAVWAMTGALLLLGVPWLAAHLAATMWAMSPTGQARVAATVIDGILSVLQVAFGVAVTAGAYAVLTRKEAAP
jgi:hypothetical protein